MRMRLSPVFVLHGKCYLWLINSWVDCACRDLTPRLVRRKVEEELAIEIGILDDIEYKDVVKDALAEAMVSFTSSGVLRWCMSHGLKSTLLV